MKQAKTQTVTAKTSRIIKKKIKARAKAQGTTRSAIINQALEKYFEKS